MNKIDFNDAFQTLVNFDGLYESLKDKDGKFLGPVVGYAGIEPTTQKNYVGFRYFNIAKVEQNADTRKYFADILGFKIKTEIGVNPTIIIGAPMGGIILATTTADALLCDAAFFEKKVTKLADPINHTKEESVLVFNRHDLCSDDKVILFEDLCNNFSTTDKMIELIKSKGAQVIAIACVFNRSECKEWKNIPVLSVIHLYTPEYKQTDPEVKKLIESGNVVWKPKAEWGKLKQAMKNENE